MKRIAYCVVVATSMVLAPIGASQAQVSDGVVKIADLDDVTGPFRDIQGEGDFVAARMAIEDFGGTVLGKPIELVTGDHLNKVDAGMQLARRWLTNEKVDMIVGLGNSAVAIGVQGLAHELGKISMVTSAGTDDLTGKYCVPTGFHWVFDTYSLGTGSGLAVLRQGGKSWFFLGSDYAFGRALVKIAVSAIEKNGGKVVGSVFHPINNTDFSSFLLQAQASGAQVIGLANAGTDTVNAIKQAAEFGINKAGKQKIAPMVLFPSDLHAVGLPAAQGMLYVSAFFEDLNDGSRAFAKRFADRHKGAPPTMHQAGTYSAVMHYLKSVRAAGTDETKAVIAKMRELPINDFMTKDGHIRVDGRVVRDFYLLTAKTPTESKGPYDLQKLVAVLPGKDTVRPLAESECPLVKK